MSNMGLFNRFKKAEDEISESPLVKKPEEIEKEQLENELEHLKKEIDLNVNQMSMAEQHKSRIKFYRLKEKLHREIDHGYGDIFIHKSVKIRFDRDKKYRPINLVIYLEKMDGWGFIKIEE